MAEPIVSNYPTSLDDNNSLGGDQKDLQQFTLDATIDESTGTISVAESIAGLSLPVYLLIGNELIYAPASSSGDFVTCVRGVSGTTAATHPSGAIAYVVYAANLFNQLKRAIIAIETTLGAALSAIITTVAAAVHGASSKTAPVDADELHLLDSDSSYVTNRLLLSNLKKYTSLNLTKTVITSGSGTFNLRAGTVMMEVELVGGGGGGGGANGAASNLGIGGGGSGGGYVRKFYTAPSASYLYAVGPGGAGQSNDVGLSGTDTTFGALTGSGGLGGAVLASGLSLAIIGGVSGVGGGAATGGDINVPGGEVGVGIRLSGTAAVAGVGGSTPIGSGGVGRSVNAAGGPGQGYGSGGGGAYQAGSSSARAGGNGADGVIIIREYGV